jgi:hypothetical protein
MQSKTKAQAYLSTEGMEVLGGGGGVDNVHVWVDLGRVHVKRMVAKLFGFEKKGV